MQKLPTFGQALLPLVSLAALLAFGYMTNIKIEILLICAACIAALLGYRLGYTYKEMENGILESLLKGMPAILIVIVVGGLIGSWIAAGSIPYMIYLGLKVISPRFFLVTACIVCSIISIVTGTSYGTAGTIGVAFIGIAYGLNIPAGQAAGAIVAGAYFGDKLSPFSDTTNLAPIAAGSNLFDHIRHMLWTTAPAWLLGLTVYFLMGIFSADAQPTTMVMVSQISDTLQQNFQFHWLLLLPPGITLAAAILKKPIIPGMLVSILVAVMLALFFQGTTLTSATAAIVDGFKPDTGNASVDKLLARGGLASMMRVTLITFCAFAFGGIMQKTRCLEVILGKLLTVARTATALIASTVASCLAVAAMTGSSYLSILIPGELFAPAYRKKKLAAKNLSRTTEDSGTVFMPLIPWSAAGVFMAGALDVPVLDYAPWAIMCYAGAPIALLYSFTGFAIAPKKNDDETVPGS